MEGFRKPVGDRPPAVYWRRRLILVGVVVALLFVAWLAVQAFAFGGNDAAAAGAAGPSEPTASPSTSPAPAAPGSTTAATAPAAASAQACGADDLAVTMVPVDFAVAADAAVFAVTLEHVGAGPCVLTADGQDTALLVTSGSERIWLSQDCPAESPLIDKQWLLEPGATQEVEVSWPRVRTTEGCTAEPEAAAPGYYWAELTVQGVTADAVQFELR